MNDIWHERDRVLDLLRTAAASGVRDATDLAMQAISIGSTISELREKLMISANTSQPRRSLLSNSECKKYSLLRAIREFSTGNPSGFEVECHQDLARARGEQPKTMHSFYLPQEVLTRDLTAGTASAGGFLVETENVGFIDMLRNKSVAVTLGAQTLPGLIGNTTVPRQSAASTGYWLATEGTPITESQPTVAQMTITPKTVGAYTEISRQLLLQSSPSAEAIVQNDLRSVIALALDLAVLNGSGSAGQPTGILNTSGVGAVAGTSLGYTQLLELQTDLLAANSLVAKPGLATTPAVASLLAQRVKFPSTASPLWEGSLSEGTVLGHRALTSNQIPAATAIFGDWDEVVIGEWGNGIEVQTNPFASFSAGIVGVRALLTCDVGIRHAAAFSVASSIT